jgi:5-methylcytosine-specific restriction enzyme A
MTDYRKRLNRSIYNTRWNKLRLYHLARNPLCARCAKEGKLVGAGIVHHVIPHKGDKKLAYDPKNLESLCKRHHDSDAQREEIADECGENTECDDEGFPIGREW